MRAWQRIGSVGILVSALGLGCNGNSLGGTDCPDPNNCTTPNPNPTAEWSKLLIMPTQVSLDAQNGAKPTQQFTVTGQRPDGTTDGPLPATFSMQPSPIGAIDPATGLFTATGEVGGSVEITATVMSNGVPVTTTFVVTVNVTKVTTQPGAPADAATKFSGTPTPSTTKSAGILYPLDNVVMPQNVYPADIQWQNGAAGDLFRVTITKPNFSLTTYLAYNGKNDYLPDQVTWSGVAQTSVDTDAVLNVDRWEMASNTVWSGAPVRMHFAKGSLLGSIYYWEILNANLGRILRINDGTNTAVNFMPTPPASPVSGERCVGCHAVSRDGRYMVGRLGGSSNVGAIFDLTNDLSGNPPPTQYPLTSGLQQYFFSSWSPDNKRLIVDDYTTLRLINTANGAVVNPVQGALPPSPATYANWSPDGNNIAYVANVNTWGDSVRQGNLSILPVTGADSFGTPKVIHTANSIPGATEDSYPSWSPDSKWIAFQNGVDSRSDNRNPGSLYIINPTGGAPIRLTNATGGSAGTETVYVPNFSPFNVGGYYWLTFITHRAYGNAQVGTAGRTGSRQQLWIAAVKNNPKAGEDPSCVPYWMPGQVTTSQNISAYWTPQACRKDSDSCTVSSQCCGGVCAAGKCAPPPADQCRKEGQTCGGSGCCANLRCDTATNVCVGAIVG